MVREGARRMLAAALEAEVNERMAELAAERAESAQGRWRAIAGDHLVQLVRTDIRFENGVLVERQDGAA
ncbi:hypothetical protein ACFYRN_43090 [Streptomyces sp. NPDC005227]|uniref:hypothetical protein n=1 Tax=Streptomyces sp. NPDC005227 TaxID=3364707 RepID=UPI0036ABA8CE